MHINSFTLNDQFDQYLFVHSFKKKIILFTFYLIQLHKLVTFESCSRNMNMINARTHYFQIAFGQH